MVKLVSMMTYPLILIRLNMAKSHFTTLVHYNTVLTMVMKSKVVWILDLLMNSVTLSSDLEKVFLICVLIKMVNSMISIGNTAQERSFPSLDILNTGFKKLSVSLKNPANNLSIYVSTLAKNFICLNLKMDIQFSTMIGMV
jgi:hypothetical protein